MFLNNTGEKPDGIVVSLTSPPPKDTGCICAETETPGDLVLQFPIRKMITAFNIDL
jgi:hypothetical protein